MALESVARRGIFRARATRDATARERDGEPFVLIHELAHVRGDRQMFEVMFEDGIWMLAAAEDLDMP